MKKEPFFCIPLLIIFCIFASQAVSDEKENISEFQQTEQGKTFLKKPAALNKLLSCGNMRQHV
ncbi:MAG: hypothetical protein B6245_22970 [Desulfobacteraceae bacterium 4572_88]|nr:MAG: hypothetical protein B6245_22970 [Desulfobacteraceae bacterium 4572_88]